MICVIKFFYTDADEVKDSPARIIKKEYKSFSSAQSAATRIANLKRKKNYMSGKYYSVWSVTKVSD